MFGEFVRHLWTTKTTHVSPHKLKEVIAKYNDLFSGNDQHDAQVGMVECAFEMRGCNELLTHALAYAIHVPLLLHACFFATRNSWLFY